MTTYTNTYNPSDPTQASFLAALQAGEDASGNPFLGTGGTNLANAPTNSYGFPQWGGIATSAGPSHAAGLYQFQPGTWNSIASQLGLNFQNPADQNAAAWNLAATNYQNQTGQSLESALNSGNYSSVASVLQPTWTSLNANRLANAFSPGGTTNASFLGTIGNGVRGLGNAIKNGASGLGGSIASFTGLTAFESTIANLFIRGGVFIVAIVVIGIALAIMADKQTGGKLGEAIAA